MSNLRVAMVAEGFTDAIVIEAALKALLPKPFIPTLLQPEEIKDDLTDQSREWGWPGVLQWCLQFSDRGHSSFQSDPTLPDFDLLVIHLDADIATKSYKDISVRIDQIGQDRGWPSIPIVNTCPPAVTDADFTRSCILSWAGVSNTGGNTILCVPSKTIESWLAAAILNDNHALQNNLECNFRVAEQMANLPKRERVKKSRAEYNKHRLAVQTSWQSVRKKCSQAERFSLEIEAFSQSLP